MVQGSLPKSKVAFQTTFCSLRICQLSYILQNIISSCHLFLVFFTCRYILMLFPPWETKNVQVIRMRIKFPVFSFGFWLSPPCALTQDPRALTLKVFIFRSLYNLLNFKLNLVNRPQVLLWFLVHQMVPSKKENITHSIAYKNLLAHKITRCFPSKYRLYKHFYRNKLVIVFYLGNHFHGVESFSITKASSEITEFHLNVHYRVHNSQELVSKHFPVSPVHKLPS